MKIQPNLEYKKLTGKIVSFVEMGDISEEKFDSRQKGKTIIANEMN